ncbi:MAG: TetR/AcrR family transcriptional regulator [Actinocrinis sp.]
MGYDPEGTRARILRAAVEEFSEHGSAGARVDRIAAKAGANKESIYRYYGSKRELLRRVLDEYLSTRGDEVGPDPQDPVGYPASVVRLHAPNPELVRLLAWEGLETRGPVDERSMQERQVHYDRKIEAFEQAQRDGVIDPELDVRLLLFSFLAMADWLYVSPQHARLIFGRELDDDLIEQYAKFVDALARRVVRPDTRADEAGDEAGDDRGGAASGG